MSIYHFSAKMVKRSAGRSAVAASAYRAGEELTDERYGVNHDYTRKQGVDWSAILAPDNAPDWMRDRSQLWNAVEAVEKRKDAQLARDITLALPHELNAEERRELVRMFVQEQFVARGMVVDVAIHSPHHKGDDRNHHAHLLMTKREIVGQDFGKKNRDWDSKQQLQDWREAWAEIQNRTFERLGIETRVDHRTLEAQGIDREPQQHEGPAVTNMKRRNDRRDVAQENERREAANDNTADLHAQLLKVRAELDHIRRQQRDLEHDKEADLQADHQLAERAMHKRQENERRALEEHFAQHYRPHLRTVEAAAEQMTDRLESTGTVRRMFRDWTGRSRADRERLDKLKATIEDTREKMAAQKRQLDQRHKQQRERAAQAFKERQEQERRAIYEADRQKATESQTGGGKLTYAQRLALRAERFQERQQGLEQKQEKQQGQNRDKGRDFEP